MGSAFHQLCPRYSGTLTPTAPTAIRLWDTFTFLYSKHKTCLEAKLLRSKTYYFRLFFTLIVLYVFISVTVVLSGHLSQNLRNKKSPFLYRG